MSCEYNILIVLCPECGRECWKGIDNITDLIMQRIYPGNKESLLEYSTEVLHRIAAEVHDEIFLCECGNYWMPFPTPKTDQIEKRKLIEELFGL